MRRLRAIILSFSFCAVFTVGLLGASVAMAQRANSDANSVQAPGSGPSQLQLEVPIPVSPLEQGVTNAGNGVVSDITQYIGRVYNFAIGMVGFVAAVMMIIGGFEYLTSAGDSGKIGAAKKRIVDAIIGMVLALGSYALLNTINPALLSFKPLSSDLTSIKTVLSFFPFCDDLAKSLKIDVGQITHVDTNNKSSIKCGDAGYYSKKETGPKGTTESRLWCVFRGEKLASGRVESEGGQVPADYGCEDNNSIQGERKIISDLSVHTLAVCLPSSKFTQDQLDKLFESKQPIPSLGYCQSCNGLSDGTAANLGYPKGDAACQIWQNVANNGDPQDNDFSLAKKKIVQDSRTLKYSYYAHIYSVSTTDVNDNHADRVYYCGYSENYNSCIYVPIHCQNVTECGDYEAQVMNYCEPENSKAEITCHASEQLGSKWGRQTGNAAHLIPICAGDPCAVGGGCSVGGLAGTENGPGGSAIGGTARMGVRVLSGGLLGSISCTK